MRIKTLLSLRVEAQRRPPLALWALGLLLSLSAWACDDAEKEDPTDTPMSICDPADEVCSLEDADGDGVFNGVDDFPLDARCQSLSNESCTACGVGCPSGLYCARQTQSGLFIGGACELAQAESCNGADDDGDSIVDEGPPADNQRGVCAGSLKVCGPTGGYINPDYSGVEGFVEGGELCDGLDNDCDGFVDEAPRAQLNLGVCEGLTLVCVDGAFQEPDYSQVSGYSADEDCDGLDNDCDGSIDEAIPGVGDSCGAGVGLCYEVGTVECRPLELRLVCTAQGGTPRAESCNGLDDDCDGRLDEQLPNTGAACVVGQGACAVEGTLRCADETGALICDATPLRPTPESCNGIDDDCDGSIDEEALGAGEGCQVGVGACARFGILECDSERNTLVCSQEPSEPSAESCNAVDDDCDGRVDEEVPSVGEGCSVGQGRCLSNGALVCDGEAGQVVCDAVEREPIEELCNNVDDDCDGDTDEEAQGTDELCTVGTGECAREAQYRCDSLRGELVCDAEPGEAAAERCNTLDDDCDGSTDEGELVRRDGFGIDWVCVPGGDYLMGWNQRANERPIHPVSVPTFEMSRTEVTVAQYRLCVEAFECSLPTQPESNWNIPGRQQYPINSITWAEALNYATWVGARLPTEAEWEFVARHRGTDARYPWGDEPLSCERAHYNNANGEGCGTGASAPVCSLSPAGDSPLGFCDLSGNVVEWTADGYNNSYNDTPRDGSAASSDTGGRVVRGGSWRSDFSTLTSTYRMEMSPSVRFDYIGARLARSVDAED